MSISPIIPARTFGAQAAAAAASNTTEQRPDAKAWLNIGYYSDPVKNPVTGEMERKFVSIPVGVPLDTQRAIGAPTERNPRGKTNLTELQVAQNDLLSHLQAAAAGMQPGESNDVQLTIQLRRVNENEAPVIGAESPLALRQPLFATPAASSDAE